MYEVILQRQPRGYYKRCGKAVASRLAVCFEALEQDPFGPGTKALKGKLQGTRRCRVGSLRVINSILDFSGSGHEGREASFLSIAQKLGPDPPMGARGKKCRKNSTPIRWL